MRLEHFGARLFNPFAALRSGKAYFSCADRGQNRFHCRGTVAGVF